MFNKNKAKEPFSLNKKSVAFTLAEVSMPKGTSGIENKVINSRESETKEPSRKNLKCYAFTLAEVLITLAIIGVVAVLTIPVVVQKYQQKMLYTQFMKMYNTFTNAVSIAVAENGEPDLWGVVPGNGEEILDKYLMPYFKVAEKIQVGDDKYDYPISLLSGASTDVYNENFTSSFGQYSDDYLLSDGSIISISISSYDFCIYISFDTNGLKGPNVLGRDIFYSGFIYAKDDTNKYTFMPEEEYFRGGGIDRYGNVKDSNCSFKATHPKELYGCAGKLLQEGAMNY